MVVAYTYFCCWYIKKIAELIEICQNRRVAQNLYNMFGTSMYS